MVSIYLDDLRPTPEGFTRTHTVEETIALLQTCGDVKILSLDNDLGEGLQEGYKVMDWLEEAVLTQGFKPPRRFRFHTDNLARRDYMMSVARRIKCAHTICK